MKKNNSKSSGAIIDIEDIKSLFRVISRNWYILLICFILAYIVSYLYTYRLTPVYGAQTQLVQESNDKINEQSIINEDYGGSYYNWWGINSENYTTLRVIKSYDLIESAVKRLKLDVSYFIAGRIKTTELYNQRPFEVVLYALNSNFYEKEVEFKIIDEDRYSLKLKSDDEEKTKNGFFNKEYIDSDIKLIVYNKAISKEKIASLSKIDYELIFHDTPTLVYRFQQALSVENPDGTNIFQIKLEDVIPDRATVFLDTLTKLFIENSLKTRLQVNSNTLVYIEKQMDEVTGVLKEIEDSLQLYKEHKNILNLTKEEEDYFNKLSQFDEKRAQFQLQMGALNSLERYIIEDKDPQFLPPDIYISNNDAFLKKGTEELYNLQISENKSLNYATGDNFRIRESKQQIEKLKNDLLIYITNSKKAIQQNIQDIENQLAVYISNIKTIPKKQREMLGIQRSLEVNQKMYLFLLEKKSNTIIGRAGIFPKIKVLEAARNIGVLRPDKNKIQLLFLVGGGILALAFIFIRLLFFTHIESLSELKRKTNYPVLGEILASKQTDNWKIDFEEHGKSSVAESFRTIRTNLQFLAPATPSTCIVITSYNPGEGKTFTSINLSMILARADKKVLLLELDLHKPRIQKVFDMYADVGITSVLIGKAALEEAIKPTSVENMSVLLSGPVPPNPSELILSENMKAILSYSKQHFDYVIIDTPPVGLISDALVLMKQGDINLFVMNTKFASGEIVRRTEEMVEDHQLKNFAYIMNGVKLKRSNYYYNRHAYGSYGYKD